MRMRWVLTWKEPKEDDPDQSRKAKARLVVVGFTDPDLTSVPRDSPTLAVRTRYLMYAIVAMHKWELCKGDITAAFLQGEAGAEEAWKVYGKPPPELLQRLGVNENYLV